MSPSFRDPMPWPSSVAVESADRSWLEQAVADKTLYAVLDACNTPMVSGMSQVYPDVQSLYDGQAAEDLAEVAPYLFQVDAAILEWYFDQLISRPCGIFIVTSTDFESLRIHLRRLLKIEAHDQRQLYFRFYDPRVLPVFLNTAPAELVEPLFGPIDSLVYLDQDESAFRMEVNGAQVATQSANDSRMNLPNGLSRTNWPTGYRIPVSESHLQAMDRYSKQCFAKRLATHLMTTLVDSGSSPSERWVQRKVTWGIENAERYDMHQEQQIARYVEVMCHGFPNHDTREDPPEIRSLMLDRRLEVDARLAQLEAIASDD